MWARMTLTILLVIFVGTVANLLDSYSRALQASAAIAQVSDSAAAYAASQSIAQFPYSGLLLRLLALVVFLVLLYAIWHARLRILLGAALAGVLLVSMSCAPSEKIVTIQPNETAFVIPLEGASNTDQAKFMSVEFLNQAKVAAKNITIPRRARVNSWFSSWVDTVQVITVDRTPVVREWTQAPGTGTSAANQSIAVESKESIDFRLGVNASAAVTEEDAAKFLYYFSGKTLAEVMDANVREFIQSQLFNEFGSRTLDQGRAGKKDIFIIVQKATQDFFKTKGVTVDYVGGAEGLTYTDPKVQEAINRSFANQQDAITALAEYEAQKTRNQTNVARAEADAEVLRITGAQLTANPQIIQKTLADRWDGHLPQYNLGSGVPLLQLPAPR